LLGFGSDPNAKVAFDNKNGHFRNASMLINGQQVAKGTSPIAYGSILVSAGTSPRRTAIPPTGEMVRFWCWPTAFWKEALVGVQ